MSITFLNYMNVNQYQKYHKNTRNMKKGILASNIGALPILQECPRKKMMILRKRWKTFKDRFLANIIKTIKVHCVYLKMEHWWENSNFRLHNGASKTQCMLCYWTAWGSGNSKMTTGKDIDEMDKMDMDNTRNKTV